MGRAEVLERVLGGGLGQVSLRMFDGSQVGPPDAAVTIEIRSPRALSYIPTGKGDLGLARAYVMGDIEVAGDLYTALRTLTRLNLDLPLRERIQLLRDLGGVRLLQATAAPDQEVRLSGRRHSKARDAKAISHHYDVSNRFYEWVLGPSMAYTCAVYPERTPPWRRPSTTKFDLVASKLGLRAGHAAARRGLRLGRHGDARRPRVRRKALGVTLSGSRPNGRRRPSPRRAWASWPRCGTWTTATCPETDSTRSAPSGSPSTSAWRNCRRTSASCTPAEAGRPVAQPLHHPTQQHRKRSTRAGSSTATSSRTASWSGSAGSSRDPATSASRSGTRRTCASTTR